MKSILPKGLSKTNHIWVTKNPKWTQVSILFNEYGQVYPGLLLRIQLEGLRVD